ncbi:hypothetical protein KP806_12540 [Paenibacillus sp. N4]|uniref:hypothetical protein n=1 Tax=Paenibacillus vietnamensis TaxID=2590547 RepID=UPI001CD095DE|nr:hypothetical protein [Paenibacillus vietnamensis]MCA0755878.1 hypothetical protein [Paenibacillus vietnamensis]
MIKAFEVWGEQIVSEIAAKHLDKDETVLHASGGTDCQSVKSARREVFLAGTAYKLVMDNRNVRIERKRTWSYEDLRREGRRYP